jgi:putative flippase GtrA
MTGTGISISTVKPEPSSAGRIARFIAVGVLNTAVGYGIYVAMVLAGAGAQIALAGQFFIGILWNFTTHSRFVFGTRGFGRLHWYVAAYLGVWAVNAAALEAMLSGLGPVMAQALLMPFTVILAYVLVGAALGARRPS